MKIKPKQKNRNPTTSKAPPPNQIIHYHINETTPRPNHPKNRNPAKHPTHPLPNQTIIKETSNTTSQEPFIMISISTSTSFSSAHFAFSKVVSTASSKPIKNRSSLRISAACCTSTAERPATGSHATTTSSLYEVLGIQAGATCQEIKAAYRRLARVVHPDVASNGQRGQTSAGDRFMKVHEAYATLSDPEKRADYDRVLYSRRPTMSYSPLGMSTCTDTMASRFSGYTRRKWETDQCW